MVNINKFCLYWPKIDVWCCKYAKIITVKYVTMNDYELLNIEACSFLMFWNRGWVKRPRGLRVLPGIWPDGQHFWQVAWSFDIPPYCRHCLFDHILFLYDHFSCFPAPPPLLDCTVDFRIPPPGLFSPPVTFGEPTLIARFMGPTWGPSGSGRTQVGPMLAPWTLLSGYTRFHLTSANWNIAFGFTLQNKFSLTRFISFWPSDIIWRHRSGLSLSQVMACSLRAPVIIWTNADISSNVFLLFMDAISQEVPMELIYNVCTL